MTAVICKAKNPATCRFHGTGSQEYITNQYLHARGLYEAISNTCAILWKEGKQGEEYLEEYTRIRDILASAEIDFFASPDGEEQLEEAINNETDLGKLLELQKKKNLADKRKLDSENGKAIPETIVPSVCKVFVFPDFKQVGQEEDAVIWEGNKYNEGLRITNIKNLLLRDIAQSAQIGYLPANLTVDAVSKAGSKMPSVSLRVKTPNNFTNEQRALLYKTLARMGKAYARAKVKTDENGDKSTNVSYDLFINIE